MHRMTRALPTEIGSPWDGRELRFKEDRAFPLIDGGEHYLKVESSQFGNHLFRVTKVIGGHHREDFAGVEMSDFVSRGGRLLGAAKDEYILPISYMLESRAFRYKGYSVMVTERPGLKVGGAWNRTCIFCHNTVPYFSVLQGQLTTALPYQGEVVDSRLPREKRAQFEITDPSRFAHAAAGEIEHLGGYGEPNAAEMIRQTRARFDGGQLIEVGIGCESCHGGSRAHVENFHVRPALGPRSDFLQVRLPANSGALSTKGERVQEINRMCARCHQVLFTRYPHTWEGGARRGAIDQLGGSNINSGEGRDFLLGGCASQMSCVTCHDPHAPDNRKRMSELEGPRGVEVCLGCHEKYRADASAHTHHSENVSCMDCHMPRKNMSLENELTRYHRIGSPTDRARVERDRPLECALCHVNKTVRELTSAMSRWWNETFDDAKLAALYGSLDANVMRATLERGKPHEQAVALDLLGRAAASDVRMASADLRAGISAQLSNPYPIVRYYAVKALERLGEKVPITLEPGRSHPVARGSDDEE